MSASCPQRNEDVVVSRVELGEHEGSGGGVVSKDLIVVTSDDEARQEDYLEDAVVVSKDLIVVTSDEEEFRRAIRSDKLASRSRCRVYSFFALFLLALTAVGVFVAVLVKRNDDSTSSEIQNTARQAEFQEIIEQVVGKEALQQEGPYSKAFQWISLQDPMQLASSAPNLVQRFILAYLYYSTSVDKPWYSCNPPNRKNEDDTCSWMQVVFLREPVERVQSAGFRWLSGVSECHWVGLSCDAFNQVRSIDLVGFNMTGSFPEGIHHLPYLQSIDLSWGGLTGSIPADSLAHMKSLMDLRLSYNAFTGDLPNDWPRNLQSADLRSNHVHGPVELRSDGLYNLKRLLCGRNSLTGAIPSTLGLLSSLVSLNFEYNFLQGSIPTELGMIRSLRNLQLSENDLSGSIPSELGRAEHLEALGLYRNSRLSGELPDEILSKLISLEAFNCNLTGNLTSKFSRMSNMAELKISDNSFSGSLPSDMGNTMPLLISLWISGNDFTGAIPESLCDLRTDLGFSTLVADCGGPNPEISCPPGCCTVCCDHFGENCQRVGD